MLFGIDYPKHNDLFLVKMKPERILLVASSYADMYLGVEAKE